jgi:hypothetical protein
MYYEISDDDEENLKGMGEAWNEMIFKSSIFPYSFSLTHML